jgi:hypothetical protein
MVSSIAKGALLMMFRSGHAVRNPGRGALPRYCGASCDKRRPKQLPGGEYLARLRGFFPLLGFLLLTACGGSPQPGTVTDEATQANRDSSSFAPAEEGFFKAMDPGVALNSDEGKGRDTWLVWTGGNDRFWDAIAQSHTFGTFDLLKIVSSYPSLKFSRDSRWQYLGLLNEPCFERPIGPDPDRFGLWLDKRKAGCQADPFEDEAKYPGVKTGARGKNMPVGSYYGLASGIVGLRLFPNPDFDAEAARRWDAKRYYDDPTYYRSKTLVRPYRVGMSCGFCHVGPSPTHPPKDSENPEWENLSSVVGAQYFWTDRIFGWESNEANLLFQILHTYRPGALDTSLVSTDYMANPRTMNAIYNLGPRVLLSKQRGKEELAGDELVNRQLPAFFQSPNAWTPRVLKDGADSVGVLGALNRVYLNIGLFSEEWLLHFNPFVGGAPITPIRLPDAERNSAYWRATEDRTTAMANFLIAASKPHLLADAPDAEGYLARDLAVVDRGKTVFADRCARCHSSKYPQPAPAIDPGGCAGPNYLACWNEYWKWTKTDAFKAPMRDLVRSADFLKDNYLSTDLRVPATLLQTNACSPLASNAIAGNIWDNFSSKTYKQMPPVGDVTVYNPFTGEPSSFAMPAGGRGYTRPASLISVWSTAPFLLNNSLGEFHRTGSVADRMRSFDDAIEKLLWPERREKDAVLGDKIPGRIDRTTARAYLTLPPDNLPKFALWLIRKLHPRWIDKEGNLSLGPIPKGTPVSLFSNLEIVPDGANWFGRVWHYIKLSPSVLRLGYAFWSMPEDPTDAQVNAAFAGALEPLLKFSKCPDFIVDRGHYFGTDKFAEEPGLSDQDKRDLIAYLKTF